MNASLCNGAESIITSQDPPEGIQRRSKKFCQAGCSATCPAGQYVVSGGCACSTSIQMSIGYDKYNYQKFYKSGDANGAANTLAPVYTSTPTPPYSINSYLCVCSDNSDQSYVEIMCCSAPPPAVTGRRMLADKSV
jgi:hypothetical protein